MIKHVLKLNILLKQIINSLKQILFTHHADPRRRTSQRMMSAPRKALFILRAWSVESHIISRKLRTIWIRDGIRYRIPAPFWCQPKKTSQSRFCCN